MTQSPTTLKELLKHSTSSEFDFIEKEVIKGTSIISTKSWKCVKEDTATVMLKEFLLNNPKELGTLPASILSNILTDDLGLYVDRFLFTKSQIANPEALGMFLLSLGVGAREVVKYGGEEIYFILLSEDGKVRLFEDYFIFKINSND